MKYFTQQKSTFHPSHFLQYISAYEITRETVDSFLEDVDKCMEEAYTSGKTIYLDYDGEGMLGFHPSKSVTLYLPYRNFNITEE